MDVGIDAACRQDLAFAGNDVGAGPDDDGDARLDVRIAGLADAGDAAILDADIGFHDAPMVEDDRIGDHHIGDLGGETLALPHAVADDLAAAEGHFVAVDRVVLLDLDDQRRVGEPHPVALGRAVEAGIVLSCDRCHLRTSSLPITLALKP